MLTALVLVETGTFQDPLSSLLNYGAIGVMAVVLALAVKKLDQRMTSNFESRLAEKDEIIERLMVLLEVQVVPAMSKSTQVIEANTHKESALVDRLGTLIAKIEDAASKGEL